MLAQKLFSTCGDDKGQIHAARLADGSYLSIPSNAHRSTWARANAFWELCPIQTPRRRSPTHSAFYHQLRTLTGFSSLVTFAHDWSLEWMEGRRWLGNTSWFCYQYNSYCVGSHAVNNTQCGYIHSIGLGNTAWAPWNILALALCCDYCDSGCCEPDSG